MRAVKKTASFILFILFMSLFTSTMANSETYKEIPSTGKIIYSSQETVAIGTNKIIGTNNLSLGFHLDWLSWSGFVNQPVRQELAEAANFKLIRVFDFRNTEPLLKPCIYWNETTKSGTWNWKNIDTLTNTIFSIGAEPLFTLGWARENIENYIPNGMAVNPYTNLPYPESWAAYCAEWVKHFEQNDFPVSYYQIMNEPAAYFGWTPPNATKLGYYVELWNEAARAMRAINPAVMLSQDCITRKGVLEYWIENGDDVDFLDFHKYDSFFMPCEYDEANLLSRAETRYFETGTTAWGVDDARQKWFTARGHWLPVINSESNMNAAADTGTDPRLQQLTGAVWLALVLRTGITKGVNYNVYFEYSSSKSSGDGTSTGGSGFGMINSDNNEPWYTYYVHQLIGSKLSIGDQLVESVSSSSDIVSLAWVNKDNVNVLLICKNNNADFVLKVNGFQGSIDYSKIDSAFSWQYPQIQTGTIDSTSNLIINGYTVILLTGQGSSSPS